MGFFGRPVHADSITLSVTDVADVGSLTAEVVDTGHGAAPEPAAIPLFSPGDCTVTSTLDTGPGSLRACMAQLGAGDVITFDTTIFLPGNPQTIALTSPLPTIVTNNVTIDGSNAGVILNGSGTPTDTSGLVIDGASNVAIKGLRILNFPGNGIALQNGASNNMIGGTNATPGGSCSGDCNLISGNGYGMVIEGSGTMNNTVSGNYIGTDASGTAAIGNGNDGIYIGDGASYNVIGGDTAGERNIIAYNGDAGVEVVGTATISNTITQNSIHSNTGKGIELVDGGNLELFPPILTDLSDDTVTGVAPPNSTVEIFSDDEDEGRVYEGSTTADATSHFTFTQPSGLTGPNTTATATDVDGNTSEFSTAYSVTHDMALVTIFSVKSRVQVGEAVTPTVEVGNAGSSTEVNVPVQVRVTTDPGGTEVHSRTETVGSIGPLAYAFVTFDAWTPGATGSYRLEASVLLPGDENGANDTKEVAVTAVVGNPEVYIKDNPQDDGSVPQFPCWESPDLWVRHEEDGGEEHQQPIANQTNTVYARIRNIGDVALDNVEVDLYWHEPALAIKCGSWRYIGQATISSLAVGETQVIHLPWMPDVSGHTCLFAQVDDPDQDPYSRDHDCFEGVP